MRSIRTDEDFDRYIEVHSGKQSLAKAIAAQPIPPCEKYNCDKYKACAREKLACKSFALYVQLPSGRSYDPADEIPTHARYMKIFSE